MAHPLEVHLSAAQREELEVLRDHASTPHVREKAAAILKIADGQLGLQVGRHGLLRERDPDTIYRWVKRYQAEGVAGFAVRRGRGRKAAFSPTLPNASGRKNGVFANR